MQKPPTYAAGDLPLRRAMLLFLFTLAIMFLVEWGYAGLNHFLLHGSYPRTTPLFLPEARFSDWTNFIQRAAHLGEPGMQLRPDLGLPYPYPLPSVYLYYLYAKLFVHATRAYLVTSLVILTASLGAFLVYLRRLGAGMLPRAVMVSAVLLGSPIAFLLDRANIEIFLWLFILLGIICFIRRWHEAAALLFALAACMKIYPALYFLLFVPRRRWRAFFLAIVASVLFTLATLRQVGPTIPEALRDMSAGARLLRDTQINVVALSALRFDHSLFALWKRILFRLSVHHSGSVIAQQMTFSPWLRAYSLLVPSSFVVLYLVWIKRLPLLNQFAILSILSVLLPYVSYEYTLIILYQALGVFLIYSVQKPGSILNRKPHQLELLFFALAVIFAPLSVLAHFAYAGQLKCLALLVVLFYFLRNQLPSLLFGDA